MNQKKSGIAYLFELGGRYRAIGQTNATPEQVEAREFYDNHRAGR